MVSLSMHLQERCVANLSHSHWRTFDSLLPTPALIGIESLLFSLHCCVLVLVVTSAVRQNPGGLGTRGTDSWSDDTDKNFASKPTV